MWLWFTDQLPPVPIGVYDHESPVPGVSSVQLPDGSVSTLLRDATKFIKSLDDLVPGLGDWFDLF